MAMVKAEEVRSPRWVREGVCGVSSCYVPGACLRPLLVARVHARLRAGLVSSGAEVGAHDQFVAATALSAGWQIGTANIRHFNRIPGLDAMLIQIA